jgi:heat shock protein HtpX
MLAAMAFVLTWGGYEIWDRYGLLVGFFTSLALISFIFYYDDWKMAARFPANELEGRDAYGVLRLTRESARRLSMPMPRVLEVPSATPFVFSVGLTRSRLKIFLSTSAIQKLTPDELRALLTFELVRFRTGLTRTTTAAAAFTEIWLTITGTLDAAFLLRLVFRRKLYRYCPGPFTWLSLPFVGLFLRLVIRGGRLRYADRRTGEITGNPRALAEALIKLDAYNKTLPLDLTLSEASHFAVNPLARFEWSRWTTIHPSIRSRVRALTGQFPL